MQWTEFSLTVPIEHVEATCAAFTDVAPGGCSVEDAVVPLGPEEGVRYEPWRPSTVRVYLPADAHLEQRRGELLASVATLPFSAQLSERAVDEDDWANAWKEFFQVEHVTPRLVIRPAWRVYAPVSGEVVLDLDPGMAFGTGQHETTRMCLVAIDELVRPGMHVLDVGCGSGILAIAAAKLGAASVTAVDTEALAVQATVANAAANHVDAVVRAGEGSLDERWPFGSPPLASYDLVLANIHAGAAIALAPAFFAALQRGGTLVASGIIAERLSGVLDALGAAGFAAPEVRSAGEWRTMITFTPPQRTE
jgi:ribosomal protein L11 methyltransferase